MEKCENKIYITENEKGYTFRRKKSKYQTAAGFINPPHDICAEMLPRKHYPAYYSHALEAWVVEL